MPSAGVSSTITPLVPIADAGSTCGLELTSTTTNGLPGFASRHVRQCTDQCDSVRQAVQAWRWSSLRQWPGSHRLPRPRSGRFTCVFHGFASSARSPWRKRRSSGEAVHPVELAFRDRAPNPRCWHRESTRPRNLPERLKPGTVVIISRGWPSGIQLIWPELPAQSPSWVWVNKL